MLDVLGASWLFEKADKLTDTRTHMFPSEWAERVRYLPRQNTAQPGPFSFDATPYWREVVDCLDPDDPTRFIAVAKGAQVGATVGIVENMVGYAIDYLRSQPLLFITADSDLAKMRVDTSIVPMLQASGLDHLIMSNDESNSKKAGRTNKKIEWAGGGYMLPLGAKNADKMRSFSVPILLRDEISGWPLIVGRDGDPLKLTEARTNSFELTRKVVDLSTPLISGTCAITKRFAMGDQRYYYVPCKHCGKFQQLRFRNTDGAGVRSGLIWEMDDERTITPGSVRYVCKHCAGEWINSDKIKFMEEGEWRPTAKPIHPQFKSYHLGALYAPHFARTWTAIAAAWCEAWDDSNNTMRDAECLQVFYNNDLGKAFELKADKVQRQQVTPHRRPDYRLGQLPGRIPIDHAGGCVEMITMAVDVQKAFLSVAIFAWAPSHDHKGYSAFVVDYFRIEGNCESEDATPWETLGEIIDNRCYAENGREYPITMTLIDAGYLPDTVYNFSSQWGAGVFPLRGRDKPTKAARFQEFDIRVNATGTRYIQVTVDTYKDRWSAALRRDWSGVGPFPRNNWSCPIDLPDKALNELAVEFKREKRDPASNKLLGTYWHRPNNARQELWDLLMYNTAAIEVAALSVCEQNLGLDYLSWPEFWREASQGLYWTRTQNK